VNEQTERAIKIAVLILGGFIIFFVTFLLPRAVFHLIFGHVVQNIIRVSGLSHWLVKGIVILSLIPLFWALCELFKIRFRINLFRKKPVISRKKFARLIVIVYIGLYFLSMFFLSKDSYFDYYNGEPLKWYAETPEGLRFYDSPGYDPVYNNKLKPTTPGIIEKYKKQQLNMYPKRIILTSVEGVEFFDSISGKPKIWYYQDTEGSFEFFDGPGFHPTYNAELKPVTPGIIINLKKKIRESQEKTAGEKEKTEEEKGRQKHLAYRQKYINPFVTNPPGLKEVAILAVDEKRREEHNIERKLFSILKLHGKNPVLTIFKKPFIDDGLFEKVFSGNLDIIKALALNNHVDYIILVKKSSKFKKNPQVWDGISSDLTIQVKIITTNPIRVVNSTSISTIGPGFSNEEAEKNAIDKAYNDLQEFLKEIF
jgi:hypothetical protein